VGIRGRAPTINCGDFKIAEFARTTGSVSKENNYGKVTVKKNHGIKQTTKGAMKNENNEFFGVCGVRGGSGSHSCY
jgi:hypothetical protein